MQIEGVAHIPESIAVLPALVLEMISTPSGVQIVLGAFAGVRGATGVRALVGFDPNVLAFSHLEPVLSATPCVFASETDSLSVLKQKAIEAPKDGKVWTQLGHAYLNLNNFKDAESAFKQGEKYGKLPSASNGRGLVYLNRGFRFAQRSFQHFRRALRADPTYIEAQLNIARAHTVLGQIDAEKAYRQVMKMDSTYAPVYLELAQWYIGRGYDMYHDEMSPLYESYIALKPDDVAGHYGLAMIYTDQKNYGAVLDVSLAVIKAQLGGNRWLALIAQAYAARGEPDQAIALFYHRLLLH